MIYKAYIDSQMNQAAFKNDIPERQHPISTLRKSTLKESR